jgi:hypothetical protein
VAAEAHRRESRAVMVMGERQGKKVFSSSTKLAEDKGRQHVGDVVRMVCMVNWGRRRGTVVQLGQHGCTVLARALTSAGHLARRASSH